MGKYVYKLGRSKRTCVYDGGRGSNFAMFVLTYQVNGAQLFFCFHADATGKIYVTIF